MAEFNPFNKGVEPVTREYNPLRNIQAAREVSRNPERDRVLLPLATGLPQEEVDQRIATGQGNQLVQTARQNAITNQWTRVERTLDRNFQEGVPPEESLTQLSELVSQNPFVGRFIDPVVMSTIMRSDNDLAKRSYLDRLQRVLILSDAISNRFQSASEEGFLNKAIDFIDTLVAVPVYANIAANRRAEFAGEITRLLDSDIDPEAFADRINEMFNEVADQGWLTNENQFLLYELFELIPEGGEGPAATGQALWATFDTVAGLTGLAGTVRAGVDIGKGMARGMAEVSTDAATLAARTGADAEQVQQLIAEAAVRDVPGSPVDPVNHMPSVVTPLNRRYSQLTPAESVARDELESTNPYIRNTFASIARGGQAVDDALLAQLRADRVFRSEESGRRAVIDYDLVVDQLDNVFYVETFGTKKGGNFTRLADATRLADQVGGKVVQVGEGQFQVRLTMPVGYTPDMFRKTNIEELGDGFWARMGSPASQTTPDLDSILKQTEAIQTKLVENFKAEFTRISKLTNSAGRNSVGKVFDDLRDGDNAWRRPYFSVDEFKSRFFSLNGRDPTPQELEYATAVQNLNNLDYFIKADGLFKEAASRNTRVLRIGETDNLVMTSKVEDLPEGNEVWDLEAKELVSKDRLSAKHNVFSMASDLYKTPDGKWVQYVATKKPTTRRIYHSDVMPYNAGGPRLYSPQGMKFFVKQEGERTLASGRQVKETPKTFLGVRLQEEAQATVEQVNNIIEEINTKLGPVPRTLDETYEAMKAADFDDVIRRNNEWNVNIQTTDDLIEFFSDNMIDPRTKVDWARDGDPIGDLVASFAPRNATYADVFRLSANRKLGRRNKPLSTYGGMPARSRPAIESIKRSVLSSVAQKSEAAYLTAAAQGVIKEVMHLENLHKANPSRARVLNGRVALNELSGLTLKGKLAKLYEGLADTAEGRKLKLEIDKISFRTAVDDPVRSGFQWLKNHFADTMYSRLGDTKVGNWMDDYSSDPFTAARRYTFHGLLGVLAPDQYLVQASQMFNIIGIHPVNGIKGAAMYPALRFLVRNGQEPVIRAWGKRLESITGLTEDQFTEMVQMLRQDGRLVTGVSVAELQDDIRPGGMFENALNKGLFFFNEGELVGRITAHTTAYMSHVGKHPTIPPSSQQGRRMIFREQDRLTASMTSASKSPFQNLPFAQFLSYSWRMSEQIFSFSKNKSILNTREKIQLATAHTAIFGLAGIPAAGAILDYYYSRYGIEVDQQTYTAMRYGVLDTMLSYVTGTDTAMSNRLAWATGATETIRNMMNMNFVEAITGPSGSVSSDVFSHLTNLIGSVTIGSSELIQADLNQLARNIKSYDMAHNVYWATVLGNYYSRSGRGIVDDDVDANERVALAMGIPLQDYIERNVLDRLSYADSRFEKRTANDIFRLLTSAQRHIELGEFGEAKVFEDQVAVMLDAVRMHDPMQAERILRQMPSSFESLIAQTLLREIERGRFTREEP